METGNGRQPFLLIVVFVAVCALSALALIALCNQFSLGRRPDRQAIHAERIEGTRTISRLAVYTSGEQAPVQTNWQSDQRYRRGNHGECSRTQRTSQNCGAIVMERGSARQPFLLIVVFVAVFALSALAVIYTKTPTRA